MDIEIVLTLIEGVLGAFVWLYFHLKGKGKRLSAVFEFFAHIAMILVLICAICIFVQDIRRFIAENITALLAADGVLAIGFLPIWIFKEKYDSLKRPIKIALPLVIIAASLAAFILLS